MENTAHLLNEIDKKLMILLRDGRTLIGYLRSVDQFANLVLHRAIGLLTLLIPRISTHFLVISERIHVNDKYGDMERGIFIIRGENVVLLGEIVRFAG
jgi:U6 snRNA-associated Sm-like protein LSm1